MGAIFLWDRIGSTLFLAEQRSCQNSFLLDNVLLWDKVHSLNRTNFPETKAVRTFGSDIRSYVEKVSRVPVFGSRPFLAEFKSTNSLTNFFRSRKCFLRTWYDQDYNLDDKIYSGPIPLRQGPLLFCRDNCLQITVRPRPLFLR